MKNIAEKYKTFGGYTPDIDESRENIDKGAENESVFIDDLTNTTVEEKDSTTTPCYREMTPLILKLVTGSIILATPWLIIFLLNPNVRILKKMSIYDPNYNKKALLQSIMAFSLVSSMCWALWIITEVYDSVNYNDRSEKQTKIQEAIVTLETSDYKAPVVHVLKPEDQKLRVSTISKRRSSILDLQILNKIRREDVYKSGEELFKKILGSDKRNYLTYEDFIPFFDDSEKAAEAYELFDPNKNGNVSLDEFLDVFFFCYSENKLLVKVKLDMSEVLEKLHTFMLAICLMIIVVVVLMLFSLEPLKNLSGLATLVIVLDVSFNTPTEKLLELTKRVQNFVDSNKLDFKSPMQVKYRAVEKSALMKIEYLFTNRSTWQNNANKWKVSNKFFLFVKEQMADLGITYSTEMQNIRIHNAHQADIDFSGETSA
ncbi:hypothetical protein AX774_g4320 [Zancudomyces culisetae]|uniref:EF-hand domain-containing protein n=1 Tax=Zancudomyces culisetae TaxID=1213189 RepID=A0A1R1PMU0_ZANCU|nr:hypothetical protein AX774_g4320 [Zancudomyces culisetae]|eukprot:OMH82202.1 hypothetical protein AX774_g4320 [Zancudomyces culisetae]